MKDKIKIGIVGFSNETKFKKTDGIQAVKAAFDNIQALFNDKEIHIVSGLTNVGIPRLAYEQAVERKWKTVGIAPKEAEEYELFPVDEKIIVGKSFGDESEVFIDYIDVLVKLGGGYQSEKETEMANAQHIPVMNMDIYFA
jgi:predicted Rossmann-fold nucleotide-binding protein